MSVRKPVAYAIRYAPNPTGGTLYSGKYVILPVFADSRDLTSRGGIIGLQTDRALAVATLLRMKEKT